MSVLIKIQPHVRYCGGANHLPLSLLPSCIGARKHTSRHTWTLSLSPSHTNTQPTTQIPLHLPVWSVLMAQQRWGWFKGPLQMGRLQVKTKTRDKSHHSSLKVPAKAIQLEGNGRTVKNIYTLHPVRMLLAYLEWLSRLGISQNGQKYIKLISRWMLSGVMMLHKS